MNGNEASLARAIRGPITLITVGILFAMNNFTEYRFSQTWPVLLIVFGLLSLLRRGTEQSLPPAPPPLAWNAPVSTPPETGSYRQSHYPAPPVAPSNPSQTPSVVEPRQSGDTV